MQLNVSLKPYTTLKIGGPASYFVAVKNIQDLAQGVAFARKKKLPWFVLGGGSNIVVSDQGYPGVVLKMELRGIEWSELPGGVVQLIAAAGESWDTVVATAVSRGWYGLENLSFIPGTVGAAPIQNIGAYGVEVKDYIEWVEVFDTVRDTREVLPAKACGFGYRDSIFKHEAGEHLIVLRVGFKLNKRGSITMRYPDIAAYFVTFVRPPTLMETRRAVGEIRAKKFPDLVKFGTAGSFFKNPIVSIEDAQALKARFPELPIFSVDASWAKIPLAWILDHVLNLRGYRAGSIGMYERQPLVLVNFGGATSEDLSVFVEHVAKQVRAATNIVIAPEVVTLTR